MAVAFGTSTASAQGGATSYSASYTLAAGSNVYLVLWVTFSANVSNISITYNSVALTQFGTVINATNCGYTYLYYLANPATGASHTLSFTWTTSSDMAYGGGSFSGVLGGLENLISNSGSGTTGTVTAITQATADAVLANFQNSHLAAFNTTHTGTQIVNSSSTSVNMATNYLLSPAASQAMTNGLTSSDNWLAASVTILGEVVAGGTPDSLGSRIFRVRSGPKWMRP